MGDSEASAIIGVATSGIQDVSALLPLLGTQQCENHIYSALQRGFLYAAATPMSIFGSLGLVKAGFLVLWASNDYSWFHGPTSLRNAGFRPSGTGELLSRVDEHRGMSVAEEKTQRILSRKVITSVTINLKSRDFWRWNIHLIAATTILSAFGLLPYILLIYLTPSKPFQSTWLYPMIRIVSCDLVAVSIPMILQIRILEEAYFRIRFLAMDNFLKHVGYTDLPDSWNYNQRSRNVLNQFRYHAVNSKSTQLIQQATNRLGQFSSFAFPIDDTTRHDQTTEVYLSDTRHYDPLVMDGRPPFREPRTQRPPNQHRRTSLFTLGRPTVLSTTLLLWPAQACLLVGVCGAVVGYIGCFKVVQASPRAGSVGPVVWLVSEALLAVIRMILWAWNPSFDDPKAPVALQKSSKAARTGGEEVISGITWDLDSATTHDLHAVVIGVSGYKHLNCGLDDLPQCTEDARRIEAYLKDTLRVPPSQVVTLLDGDATVDRILGEINALAHKETLIDNAPVVIYISTSALFRGVPYILPHVAEPVADVDDLCHRSIYFPDFEKLLDSISRKKTDNIVVIMDCCLAESTNTETPWLGSRSRGDLVTAPTEYFATSLFEAFWTDGKVSQYTDADGQKLRTTVQTYPGQEYFEVHKFYYTPSDSTSYVLIASARSHLASNQGAGELGLLTASLLDVLTRSVSLGTMTYGQLLQEVSDRMDPDSPNGHPLAKAIGRAAIQHPTWWTYTSENRLLFDGLFARRLERGSSSPVITVCYVDP